MRKIILFFLLLFVIPSVLGATVDCTECEDRLDEIFNGSSKTYEVGEHLIFKVKAWGDTNFSITNEHIDDPDDLKNEPISQIDGEEVYPVIFDVIKIETTGGSVDQFFEWSRDDFDDEGLIYSTINLYVKESKTHWEALYYDTEEERTFLSKDFLAEEEEIVLMGFASNGTMEVEVVVCEVDEADDVDPVLVACDLSGIDIKVSDIQTRMLTECTKESKETQAPDVVCEETPLGIVYLVEGFFGLVLIVMFLVLFFRTGKGDKSGHYGTPPSRKSFPQKPVRRDGQGSDTSHQSSVPPASGNSLRVAEDETDTLSGFKLPNEMEGKGQ